MSKPLPMWDFLAAQSGTFSTAIDIRVEAHEGLAGALGQARETEEGAAAHAHHGAAGHLPESRTSRPAPEHRVYPCLLEEIRVTVPNQAWAADITYLPMARGSST